MCIRDRQVNNLAQSLWTSFESHSNCFNSFNQTSLSTGRSRMVDFTLAFTLRTNPFFFGKTCSIIPRGQELLEVFSAATNTTSPTARLRWGYSHFWRVWRNGRYSRAHLSQTISERYWICRHIRRERRSSFWKTPGGIIVSYFSNRRWFGVKGSNLLILQRLR